MIDNDNKIDNTVSLQILKTMLSFVDIDFTNIEKLIGNEIDRDCFLETDVIEKFNNYKITLKNAGYSSCKLTSLHTNNTVKQKYPAINMLRQILKCNNLWLKPVDRSCDIIKTQVVK